MQYKSGGESSDQFKNDFAPGVPSSGARGRQALGSRAQLFLTIHFRLISSQAFQWASSSRAQQTLDPLACHGITVVNGILNFISFHTGISVCVCWVVDSLEEFHKRNYGPLVLMQAMMSLLQTRSWDSDNTLESISIFQATR